MANVSQQGTTDRQKILHTPLWIALATGNVEALGLIGNADNRRDVWFDLATGSGDVTVRKTAMEALARSSASQPVEHLRKIYELSEDLNNSDILDSAIDQIGRVVRVMERHPDPARFRPARSLIAFSATFCTEGSQPANRSAQHSTQGGEG